jgi:hypothetical protein
MQKRTHALMSDATQSESKQQQSTKKQARIKSKDESVAWL